MGGLLLVGCSMFMQVGSDKPEQVYPSGKVRNDLQTLSSPGTCIFNQIIVQIEPSDSSNVCIELLYCSAVLQLVAQLN